MNRKEGGKLTVSGAIILEKIMRSCPPTIFNGGKIMKKYLLQKVADAAIDQVCFFEIVEKFQSLKVKKGMEMYDVYDDLNKFLNGKSMDFWCVADFFSGEYHISQAIKERNSEELFKIAELEKEAYLFSHILTPVIITDVKDGVFDGCYSNGVVTFSVKGLRAFPLDKRRFSKGSIVFAHYSCIIDEIDEMIANRALNFQKENQRFMEACLNISEEGVDHSRMAYDPWCEKITA